VIEALPGQTADAKAMGCNKQLVFIDQQWRVKE